MNEVEKLVARLRDSQEWASTPSEIAAELEAALRAEGPDFALPEQRDLTPVEQAALRRVYAKLYKPVAAAPTMNTMPPELEALYGFHKNLQAEGFLHQSIDLWNRLEKLHLWLRAAAPSLHKESAAPVCSGPFSDARDCPIHRSDVFSGKVPGRVETHGEERKASQSEQNADSSLGPALHKETLRVAGPADAEGLAEEYWHGRKHLVLVEWIGERIENCKRLAAGKTGADQKGWLEDARYFEQIAAALHKEGAGDSPIARCQQRHQETGQCELRAGHEGSHLAGYIMWAGRAEQEPAKD